MFTLFKKLMVIGAVSVVVTLTTYAAMNSTKAKPEEQTETYRQLTLFGDVFNHVRSDYVESVTDQQLIEAAIHGMLTSLDPHSAYLPEEHFKRMQIDTSGIFGGLGIEITMERGFVKIVSPIDDTPAAKAGLKPEDLIISVDGKNIVGVKLSEAVASLRGPVDSKVVITVQRAQNDPFDVTLIRDEIKIRSVRSRLYDNIGYIRLTTFSEQTTPGLQKEFKALHKEAGGELHGLILDLRNNPGGLLSQAIKVADAFLHKGEIVSTRGRHTDKINQAHAKKGDISNGLPMIVLINSGSASASEIVAGALKDHKRAILMGTRTFGKGSVQTVTPIPNHGAVRMTTARYYTPAGISIQATGITPDIEVALARIEKIDGGWLREEDLRGALDGHKHETKGGGKDETKDENHDPEAQAPSDPSEIDYQLARALDLLRGVSVFSALNG